MVDVGLLSFSFLQGALAFFAPCAVSLLPGYLSSFVAKNVEGKPSNFVLLKRALFFAILTILGIATIYGIATVLVMTFREVIKSALVYIAIGLGVGVIILGGFMLFNKPLSLPLHSPSLKSKSQLIESYLFGVTYGIGVLGCLFPFFLMVVTIALGAPTILEGSSYMIAYILGMSFLMVVFYAVAQFAQSFLQQKIIKFMPYVNRVGGAFIMVAGAYIIWYQSVLL